ncbi:UVI-1 protein [Lasiosphaeria hispida]|uniref:UVI-1 protein n=1 Tax=Lasiosphaeria hispida TaxID=260671 RepID=A0AAJ0HFA4_9PEZI|nr:UVI-1 protein [Lasiosphaeria hispida]
MRLSLLSTLAVLAGATSAQLRAGAVINNIETLTTESRNLIEPAGQIDILSGPRLLAGEGPLYVVITGFGDIVKTAISAINSMGIQGVKLPLDAADPAVKRSETAATDIIYGAEDSAAIADAFRTFVDVHKQLLNVVIGKAGVLISVPYIGLPMAKALRLVEAVIDSIAYSLIDTVEATASAAMRESTVDLDNFIRIAIGAYT